MELWMKKRSVKREGAEAQIKMADMLYRIVEGSEKIDINEVVRLLRMTYWAGSRSLGQIEKSMAKCIHKWTR